ncbi:hypothetical protein TPHA_0C00730 [Tetrapisispora phaffii CBS 4417]|uniref:Uncharacterized protein n=1 Tax=Tetrapisispora phaffii (strain ATCC 24235 / CBS 4417 / NBRC 1672 / NRRL Y-8282 / UCD 70-5) TaxID=1071381 RepID=G8BR53_TETPH|nr:hypothetical protein TPHA_0C00730 [Tetrapisispora phaffii CBS 4417]CCE62229.1 hypothetical protein TPHA_0C00730 [Tetrapisispora phaffii CBS 4417]
MMKPGRRFNISSTLNSPVVIHKRGRSQHLNKEEVLAFLDNFISEKENLLENEFSLSAAQEGGDETAAGTGNKFDNNLTVSLAQLKRLQRDFKGLPPSIVIKTPVNASTNAAPVEEEQEEQEESKDASGNIVTKSASGGSKMKFTDDD